MLVSEVVLTSLLPYRSMSLNSAGITKYPRPPPALIPIFATPVAKKSLGALTVTTKPLTQSSDFDWKQSNGQSST